MNEHKDIELRSEKVRSIVGKMPPIFLRVGISIIAGIILVILGLLYVIPYPRTKTFPVQTAYCDVDSIFYVKTQLLPMRQVRPVEIGQKTSVRIFSIFGDYELVGCVCNMTENGGRVCIFISLSDVQPYIEHLQTLPDGNATIFISRKPILKWGLSGIGCN